MPPLSLRLRKPSSRQLVERIVSEPQLAASVQALTPHRLGQLIQHVGLEDSGELIALATTEQIEKIFDDDLWAADRPGTEERFDVDRFVLWLQVMFEVGERFTAEKLEELPEDLVVLALHRCILVVNVDELQPTMSDDEESEKTEKALESSLYEEFDEHMIIARRADGWDAILAALLTLDTYDPALRRRILERCHALSNDYIEDNGGLYEVLTSEQMLEGDLAGERDDRRSDEGFVAPTAAASFLNLARLHDPDSMSIMGRDAVTQMYMRRQRLAAHAAQLSPPKVASKQTIAAQALDALIRNVSEEPSQTRADPRLRLGRDCSGPAPQGSTLFQRALGDIAGRDTIAQEQRLDEIAFLCNVLISGCPIAGRAFRPYEAILATTATCNLGLERLAAEKDNQHGELAASDILRRVGVDGAFRLGFSILHHQVARKALAVILARVQTAGAAQPSGKRKYAEICHAAAAALTDNKPWQFASNLFKLDELFDGATIDFLHNLLGEFPVLVGSFADDPHRPYRIDGRHAFISTAADVQDVGRILASISETT